MTNITYSFLPGYEPTKATGMLGPFVAAIMRSGFHMGIRTEVEKCKEWLYV